jgi:hypothetical protein
MLVVRKSWPAPSDATFILAPVAEVDGKSLLTNRRQPGNNPESHKLSGQVLINSPYR